MIDTPVGRNKPKQNHKPGTIDNCQSPIYAMKPLLDVIPKDWIIWEPAAGHGNLVRAFHDRGYKVIGTDITTHVDFFRVRLSHFDCIVTNPPYSRKFDWLEKCYRHEKPFALLLPGEAYFAQRVQRMEQRYGQLELIRFTSRINFHMPNIGWEGSSAQFPTAWFCHGLNIGSHISAETDRFFGLDQL